MDRNDVILGLAAAVLVVFSLVVSLLVPRRYPDFPGRNLRLFVAVAALLVLGMLGAVEVFGKGHETGKSHEAEAQGADTAQGDTGEIATETVPTQTTEQGEDEPEADPAAGKEVFASAGCGGCHVLADTGASGTAGPILDEAKPPFDEVVDQVTTGGGGMPSFKDQLSEQEIENVAAYVVQATQG